MTTLELPHLVPLDALTAAHSGPGYLLGTTDDGGPLRWDPATTGGALHIMAGAGSGRTHLARGLALQAHAHGHRVVVLDGSTGHHWQDLAKAGATVHAARSGTGGRRAADHPARSAHILQVAQELAATATQDRDTPPHRRTLVVLDNATPLLAAPVTPQNQRALARALGWVHLVGRLAGIDLVTVAMNFPVPQTPGWVSDRETDTFALARFSTRMARLVGLESHHRSPVDIARFLVATPQKSRHLITAPDTRSRPGGNL